MWEFWKQIRYFFFEKLSEWAFISKLFCWNQLRVFWKFWLRVPSGVKIPSTCFFSIKRKKFRAYSNALYMIIHYPKTLHMSYYTTQKPYRTWYIILILMILLIPKSAILKCSWVAPKILENIRIMVAHGCVYFSSLTSITQTLKLILNIINGEKKKI